MAPLAVLGATLLVLLALWGLSAQAQPESKQKGISYASFVSGPFTQPDADLSLGDLAGAGANWVSLVVTGYQSAVTSTTIVSSTAIPSDSDLVHAISRAHSLGLKVMLKPHVDLANDPAHWRGQISFTSEADWAAWFTSYTSFMEHYADLARANGVEQFSVGTELMGTTSRSREWRAVVAAVRSRYSGPLVYAADWAFEAMTIDWWDAVDYIGVDAYWPLTGKNDPTVPELVAAWEPHVADLAGLASRWGKSIIFTEIGYQSRLGANNNPAGGPGSLDLQEQANAYQAVFESAYGQPWLAGIYWWFWGVDPFEGGPCDTGFTPHNKPAEDVLRHWYGAPARPIAGPAPPPDYSRVMSLYGDSLNAAWQDVSWDATRSLLATDQVYSGTTAISVTLGAWGGLTFQRPPLDSDYYWLELFVRGSSPGEQHLWAFLKGHDGAELRKRPVDDCRYVTGGTIDPGAWKRVLIPMADLNPNGRPFTTLSLQERSGQAATSFWVDEIRLAGTAHRTYVSFVVR